MATVQQLEEIITPAIEALGFELYGCEFRSQMRSSRLVVYVDGVTLDDCSKISRQIAAVLDVEDPINGRYELEVSSPGIERPLFQLAHYELVVGQAIKIRLRQAHVNKRNFTGVLQAVLGDQVKLSLEDGSELVIAFNEIEKAKLISDFKSKGDRHE